MRVGVPNLLIIEFVAVDRFTASSVSVCRVSTLHHEALDHAVEPVTFVVEAKALAAIITGAETSKVLTSLGDVRKKLKDNALLNVVILTFSANRDVEEHLGILGLEFGQFIKNFLNFACLFFIVNSFAEEFLHSSFLRLLLCGLLYLDELPVVSVGLVLGVNHNSGLAVPGRIVKRISLKVSVRPQEQSFGSLLIKANCLIAAPKGFPVITSLVADDSGVLQKLDFQVTKLFVIILDGVQV